MERLKRNFTVTNNSYEVIFSKPHTFSNIQVEIIKGVLHGLEYNDIAQINGYSEGSIRNNAHFIYNIIADEIGIKPRSMTGAIGMMLSNGILIQVPVEANNK